MRKKKEAVRHLDEYFGDMLIREIGESDINRWLDGGSIKGKYLPYRSWNRPRAWGRARRFMGTAVRPSFLTDRRDDMGVASFRNAACRKGRGKGEGG